jgi:hypothetical protein
MVPYISPELVAASNAVFFALESLRKATMLWSAVSIV